MYRFTREHPVACAAFLWAISGATSCGSPNDTDLDAAVSDGGIVRDSGGASDGGLRGENVHFIVVDDETDALLPARVELTDLAGKPRPLMFSNDNVGVMLGRDAFGQLGSIGLLTGDGEARIAPGTYDFTFQRGIEYDVERVRATVPASGIAEIRVRLRRAFATTGWAGGDFHVHQAPSNDSDVPAQDRVVSMVIEGVEIVAASDHNEHFDLAGAIAQLGMNAHIFGISGNEITLNAGHWNIYPVNFDAMMPRGGGPDVNLDWDVATALATFRAVAPGDSIVQLNHPRLAPPLGYFEVAGWNPATGTVARPPLIVDYDAIEILNGIEAKRDDNERILVDWLALMERGHVLTPMGNSDTHKIALAKSGLPRTYLRVPDDRPSELTYEVIRDAIRNRHALATSGPWLEVAINGSAGMGDTIDLPAGVGVELKLHVAGANFVPVDRIRVYANGVQVVGTFAGKVLPIAVPSSINHLRYDDTVMLPPPSVDTFYVIVVDAQSPLPRELAGRLDRDTFSYAVSSPLFVNVGGDGFMFPKPRLSPLVSSGHVNLDTMNSPWWRALDPGEMPPHEDLPGLLDADAVEVDEIEP